MWKNLYNNFEYLTYDFIMENQKQNFKSRGRKKDDKIQLIVALRLSHEDYVDHSAIRF